MQMACILRALPRGLPGKFIVATVPLHSHTLYLLLPLLLTFGRLVARRGSPNFLTDDDPLKVSGLGWFSTPYLTNGLHYPVQSSRG